MNHEIGSFPEFDYDQQLIKHGSAESYLADRSWNRHSNGLFIINRNLK